MVSHKVEFSNKFYWLRNFESSAIRICALAWFWGVNKPCTAANDRFHVALWAPGPKHCLFGEWCSAVKCWPSWQPLCWPFGPVTGACLARTSQADWHPVVCGGPGRGGFSDRETKLLAEHPGARPGLVPAGTKAPLILRSSRLCGDSHVSLHLQGQHQPFVMCLSLNKCKQQILIL